MSQMKQKKLITVSPEDYAKAAVLANAVGEQMLARLEWMTLQPKVVLDLGCGTGHCAGLLQKRYPEASILGLDIAYPMLQFAKQQGLSPQWVSADIESLPLKDHSVDLLFANLVLPWCGDIPNILQEWRRVLRPDGLLLFSSLGPDTLLAWRQQLADFILPNLTDMHDDGDALTQARFVSPVLDVDHFTLTYRSQDDLLQELVASGLLKITATACEQLVLSSQDQHQDQQESHGLFATTYEVIYGHAFGPAISIEQSADEYGTVKFPLSYLRR